MIRSIIQELSTGQNEMINLKYAYKMNQKQFSVKRIKKITEERNKISDKKGR